MICSFSFRSLLAAAAVLLAAAVFGCADADAQGAVQAYQPQVYGHGAMFGPQSNYIMDAGGPTQNGLPPTNLTNPGTSPLGYQWVNSGLGTCGFSAYANQTAWSSFCMGFDGSGNALLSISGVNQTPSAYVNLNGVRYPLVAGGGNMVGPSLSVADDLPSFTDTTGKLIKDSGFPSAGVPAGTMLAFPPANWSPAAPSACWTWVSPPGVPSVNCASTVSAGLAEAMAIRAQYGLSMRIYGPGENLLGGGGGSSTYPYMSSTVAINTGQMAQQSIIAQGVNLTIAGVTGCAFTINTMNDGSNFYWGGLIVDGNNAPTSSSHAVCIQPTSNAPVEGFPIVVAVPIYIGGIAFGTGGAPSVAAGDDLFIDPSTASVQRADITVGEINCNGPGAGAVSNAGIRIGPSTLNTAMFSTHVRVFDLHNCVNGVIDGGTVVNPGPFANDFRLDNVSLSADVSGNKGIAFDEFGYNNDITMPTVNTFEGPYNTAIKFETGSGASARAGAIGDRVHIEAEGYSVGIGWIDVTAGAAGHDMEFNGNHVLGRLLVAWTPALNFSSASTGITYSLQSGAILQNGKEITADFNLTLTSKGSASGVATIAGLPIEPQGTYPGVCSINDYSNMASLTGQPFGSIPTGTTSIALYLPGSAGQFNIADTNFTNTTLITGTCHYLTN
ncbi:MAG TPA: hypothetical protein VKS24_25025 [Bradyrhizobium sp.]|nr:hypothetical protein [Bradyrhizobium sp.]